jgi:acyl-CoA thioester hydrolase
MTAMIHWTEVTLRPTDRDEVGHVNNVVFATLTAAGRVDFIAAKLEPHAAPGTDFWLVRIEIDYLRQLHYPGSVRIGTGVERMGRSSITLLHELEAEDGTAARARSVLVHVEPKSGASLALPEALRHALGG